MIDFFETKHFGAASVGVVSLGTFYEADMHDWLLLIVLPAALVIGYLLIHQHEPSVRVPLDHTPDHQHCDCRPGDAGPLPFRPAGDAEKKIRSGIESSVRTASR
jgi:hypothetical protein